MNRTHTHAARLAALVGAGLMLSACSLIANNFGFERQPTPQSDLGRSGGGATASVFSLPRLSLPGLGGGGLPASERQCRAQLKRWNVTFQDIPPIRDSSACYIDYPVKVSALARGVELKPAGTLNCQTALAMAQWVQRDAGPAARARFLTGIAEVRNVSSYSCRRIRGSRQWSEHSKGNALDVGSFKLKNGKVVDVAKPGFFAMRERSFLNNVRAGACDRFTTVLGPGSDAAHADHFHFDLRQRKSGYRHCD